MTQGFLAVVDVTVYGEVHGLSVVPAERSEARLALSGYGVDSYPLAIFVANEYRADGVERSTYATVEEAVAALRAAVPDRFVSVPGGGLV